MKVLRLVSLMMVLTLGLVATSCKKVNDADLQQAAQTALASNPDAAEVVVTVANQVATLTGMVKDDATSASVQTTVAAVKNIKSVVNNLQVAPPAPDFTQIDAALSTALTDALKDHQSVTANVQNGVITLEGEASRDDLAVIIEKVHAFNPQQVVNNITVK